jgi:uncharacterized protein (DUF362 family)
MALSRRVFLKTSVGAVAASSMLPALGVRASKSKDAAQPSYSQLNLWPGRCVHIYNAGATEGPLVNREVVTGMVDDAIMQLTGEKNVGAAWKKIFPATLSEKSKIAIKVNILNDKYPPHAYVAVGIVEGLKKIMVNGKPFPASNISIYDSNNRATFERAGYLDEYFPGVSLVHHGKTQKDFGDGAHDNTPYAETLNTCDFLINLPGLRGHKGFAGNVTLGFKSHYGTYPPKYHNVNTQPYLCDINCTGPVYEKTVLTVVGAIFGLREGNGPWGEADSYLTYAQKIDAKTTQESPNTVIMSTDPVTAEFQAIKVMRMRDGKPCTLESMPDYLKASAGVPTDIGVSYNIGVLAEDKMDVRRIVNGKVV